MIFELILSSIFMIMNRRWSCSTDYSIWIAADWRYWWSCNYSRWWSFGCTGADGFNRDRVSRNFNDRRCGSFRTSSSSPSLRTEPSGRWRKWVHLQERRCSGAIAPSCWMYILWKGRSLLLYSTRYSPRLNRVVQQCSIDCGRGERRWHHGRCGWLNEKVPICVQLLGYDLGHVRLCYL